MKRNIRFSFLWILVVFGILILMPAAQAQQVIGIFPNTDGGFEGQTAGSISVVASVTATQTVWSSVVGGTFLSTGGRSGPFYANVSQSGTSHKRVLQSPTTSSATTQAYTVQFYYRGDLDGTTASSSIRGGLSSNGTSTSAYGSYVNNCATGSIWTKYVGSVTTTGTGLFLGVVSVNNTAQFDIDDFVVYAGTEDVTAPGAAGTVSISNATTTSLDVSWGAAADVDGGGYVVVRYASSPGTDDDPLVNGIYAVGNSVAGGVTGTVRYIGTGTSFTDNVGMAQNTTYYYKVYTCDKAFNYSTESEANGSTLAGPAVYTSTTSLSDFGLVGVGMTSGEKTYTVNGDNLTTDITVTAPAGFEVSTTSGSGFGSSVLLTPVSNSVPVTTIYVRAVPSATGPFSGDVTNASTGATTLNVAVSATGVQYYYSNASGNLNEVGTWGTDLAGSTNPPADFTTNYHVFNVRNNATPTLGAAWTVSGTNAKIIVGDGTNACAMTIPSGYPITGTVDVQANGTVVLLDATSPTWGTLATASTVSYEQATSVAVPTGTTFGNLTLKNSTKTFASGTLTIQGNLVVDNVASFSGAGSPFSTLNLAGNMTLQNGSTMNSSDASKFTLNINGTSAQTMTGLGDTLYFFQITLSNAAGLTIASTAGAFTVKLGNTSTGNRLNLLSGVLATGDNTVALTLTNSVNRLNGYVNGNLKKNCAAAAGTVRTFEVGTANGYSPVTVTFGTVSTAGDLTVKAHEGSHPNTVTPTEVLNRYWTMTNSGTVFDTYSAEFSYLAADFHDAVTEASDEASLVMGKYATSTWTFPTMGTRTAGGSADGGKLQVTGLDSFSDFVIGKNYAALPVQFVSFTASAERLTARLTWKTATETQNVGFEIERRAVGTDTWTKIGFVPGAGTSTTEHEYAYTDANVSAGTYAYRIKQLDKSGSFVYFGGAEVEIGAVAKTLTLGQNYPNPFNPETHIEFTLPENGQASLKVYNMLGQEVSTLFNNYAEAGKLLRVSFKATNLPSGVYFARLQFGGQSLVRQMVYMR